MHFQPITYNEPLFRPPAEAFSTIFQVTIGCSWNRCTFCEMYTSKRFSVRKHEDILEEIKKMSALAPDTRKVFLGDGNAMVLSTDRLLRILDSLNDHFPKLRRVSAYALPKELLSKPAQELEQLKARKLSLVYVGLETGDDDLLKMIHKGETASSAREGLMHARAAGINSSVMILNGLGGKAFSTQHALHSAQLINATNPAFLSTLVLSYPFGIAHFIDRTGVPFEPLTTLELVGEMKLFMEQIEAGPTVFRSNHASNYLELEGTLPKDKQRLLDRISQVLNNPETAKLREEWQRGL